MEPSDRRRRRGTTSARGSELEDAGVRDGRSGGSARARALRATAAVLLLVGWSAAGRAAPGSGTSAAPVAFSHALHPDRPCATCHARPGDPRRPPPRHARCEPCHAAAAAPAMSACAGCHVDGAVPPRLATGPLAVGAAFSHPRHRRWAGDDCRGCHRGVDSAAGPAVPAPPKASCAATGCHDGAAAFAVTTSCSRCHARPPAAEIAVARPSARFSHDAHAARLPIDRCATCHRVDRRGEAVSTGHASCSGCHADDFTRLAPATCGACHVATEPWRRLRADQLPRATSELGAALPHADHAAIACASCHQLTTATRELRPPRGHQACAGAGCHGLARGPKPGIDTCDGCHQRGRVRRREREAEDRPWSVRARFRHRAHAIDPRHGAPLGCDSCHSANATTMPPPSKPTCAPCHDGATAFKITGHDCARCHGR